ncbi:MAG: RdgB/HAM1 family non-canonical purine NTP pyrophosphatase [Firmicutes bacterium]|nr:RdgB/HAM1 family non-canonical purine NTP pyrophosphatase [Bacillota bacterium]
MEKLVIASNNLHKIKEIKEILKGNFSPILSLDEAGVKIEVEETGKTFYENAFLKAKAVSELTDCAALADDSGLEVDALAGAPGVISARFAGISCNDLENNYKLLNLMQNIENRSCKFVSSVVLYYPDKQTLDGFGECKGTLLRYFDGNKGFGYDPLFFCLDLKKTFGNADNDEKNRVSHRYKALSNLLGKLMKG